MQLYSRGLAAFDRSLRGKDGERVWERGWRIGDRTGISTKVLVCVGESDDAIVYLRVNDEILAQGIPPWITRRRQGETVEASSVTLPTAADFAAVYQIQVVYKKMSSNN